MEERLDLAPCGYVTISQEGMLIDMNKTFLQMIGFSFDDLSQKHIETIMSKTNQFIFHTYFYPYIRLYGHMEELFLSLQHKDGQSIPVLLNGKKATREGADVIDCVLVSMGKRIGYEQEIRLAKKQLEEAFREKELALSKLEELHEEIEEKQEKLLVLNSKLEKLAITDKLTGLKNRRYFHIKLEEMIIQYEQKGQAFSLCLIDIDHFKQVNDTWGHTMGDQVLEQLAKIADLTVRPVDTLLRYGGEEFIVLLPFTNAQQAKNQGERLRQEIEAADWVIGEVTISMGIATYTSEDTHASVVEKADQALYYSKRNGRNRITHIDDL